jgi:hypothetical protein
LDIAVYLRNAGFKLTNADEARKLLGGNLHRSYLGTLSWPN